MTSGCETDDKIPASAELLARVRSWIAADPDPDTRAELKSLLACNDGVALADRFDHPLSFGTAGLRGAIGAGPSRMNRVVVAHASAGFASYLLERADVRPVVVIGRDARTKSDLFAEDAARTFAGAGCDAILLDGPVPTPVLAFAVRYLNADAGVMVTASHNPAADNGYKVYLGGADEGAQIVSPTDAEIQDKIRAASAIRFAQIPTSVYRTAGPEIRDAYVAETAAVAPATPGEFARVVYTPMHGVGLDTFTRVLTAAGYPMPTVVTVQAEPDSSFPTLPFPNPEEEGALDKALAIAKVENADLIVAHDPDADRLSVSVSSPQGFRTLTGNELGALLGWWIAERASARGEAGTFATTFVSAPALERIAAHYGFESVRTPSGFKWIGRVPNLLFGYEEALGYLVNPNTVHDKDGISAAVAILSLATDLYREGRNLSDVVDEIATRFGGVASYSLSIRFERASDVASAMVRTRSNPPASMNGAKVESVEDYLPATNLLAWNLSDGTRVLLRPSGTEPKLKIYVFADTAAQARTLGDALTQSAPWSATS